MSKELNLVHGGLGYLCIIHAYLCHNDKKS